MRRLAWIVVVVIALAAPASASETGFYLGAGFGVSSLDVRDFSPELADLRFKEENFGTKLFAGWRPFKYFAVEAGYTDFGNVRQWEGGNVGFFRETEIGVSMWDAYAVGLLPLSEKVDFFGKLGYASWDVSNRITSGGETENLSDSGTGPAFGLGLALRFKKLGARVEGDWLQIPDTSRVFLVSVSLTYIF
jgi:OOP family OmpA-OmpF porin